MAKQEIPTMETPQEEPIVSLEEAPSNTNAAKERADKQLEAVVEGNIKVKKPGLGNKVKNIFISDDVGDVKSYLIFDIIVPAMKDTLSEVIKGGIDAVLYGQDRPRNVNRRGSSARVSYQSYYDKPYKSYGSPSYSKPKETARPVARRSQTKDIKDIVFENRSDAIAVLDDLVELTISYEFATIMDLKQLCGQKATFVDNDFGWEDLSSARVQHVRGGFVLDMPTPVPID